MELPKSDAIAKLNELEEELRDQCTRNGLKEMGDFTILFDAENGRNILYVMDMPIEETGGMREFYDRNSSSFHPDYRNISWPYTGFVQGDMAGWMPISPERLAEWLQRYSYTVEGFIERFHYKPPA